MNAMVYTRYGPPEVVQLKEVDKPTPKDNEVLVRIDAAVVSRGDCTARKGAPVSIRLATGLLRPKKPILGTNLAGEIEAVGKAVTRFSPVIRSLPQPVRGSVLMPSTSVCRKMGRWRRSRPMRRMRKPPPSARGD